MVCRRGNAPPSAACEPAVLLLKDGRVQSVIEERRSDISHSHSASRSAELRAVRSLAGARASLTRWWQPFDAASIVLAFSEEPQFSAAKEADQQTTSSIREDREAEKLQHQNESCITRRVWKRTHSGDHQSDQHSDGGDDAAGGRALPSCGAADDLRAASHADGRAGRDMCPALRTDQRFHSSSVTEASGDEQRFRRTHSEAEILSAVTIPSVAPIC